MALLAVTFPTPFHVPCATHHMHLLMMEQNPNGGTMHVGTGTHAPQLSEPNLASKHIKHRHHNLQRQHDKEDTLAYALLLHHRCIPDVDITNGMCRGSENNTAQDPLPPHFRRARVVEDNIVVCPRHLCF